MYLCIVPLEIEWRRVSSFFRPSFTAAIRLPIRVPIRAQRDLEQHFTIPAFARPDLEVLLDECAAHEL
jgi:hypothetical protein